MKKKGYIIMLSAVILFLLGGTLWADQRTFPTGSIIIPMDSTMQPDSDHGIFEAYGMLYALLDHKDAAGDPDPIPVFWCINPYKTLLTDTDFSVITDSGGDPVSAYDHAGGTVTLTTGIYTNASGDKQIDYFGGPFVIDAEYAAEAKTIINNWTNVNVHIANVPFTSDIGRMLDGVPPKIALLNDQESHTTGNAVKILSGYLDIAGITSAVYDVVTPNEVGGIATTVDGVSVPADSNGILQDADGNWTYNLLWAPHWTAYERYNKVDANGVSDATKIISKIGDFLDGGNALFAECASIENFEYHPSDAGAYSGYNAGPWLTTNDIAHDGGTMDPATMTTDDPTIPFIQTGDFSYVPEGGHLHNWQPLTQTNTADYDGVVTWGAAGSPTFPPESAYVSTVKRFIYDTTGWDYYVGGYKDGDENKGFIVYLGGHTYVSCGGGGKSAPPPPAPDGTYQMELEFTKDCGKGGSSYTISVDYDYEGAAKNTSVTFTPSDYNYVVGDTLVIDVTGIQFDKKKIKNVIFKNNGGNNLTITHIDVTFNGGEKLKKFTDVTNDVKLLDDKKGLGSVAGFDANHDLQSAGSGGGGSGPLSNCTAKNAAAVQYVLNTVFDLQAYVNYKEFIKSSPVVDLEKSTVTGKYDTLVVYSGSFTYPSYTGHLRALEIQSDGSFSERWDAANGIPTPAGRTLFTAVDNTDADAQVNNNVSVTADSTFLQTNHELTGQTIDEILNISPDPSDYSEEIAFLTDFLAKPLGGIVHSTPAVVGPSPFVDPDRKLVVYAGATDGMLHAFDAADGSEIWGFIPNNLLGKLYADTLLEETDMPKAIVDGAPAVADMLVDLDGDGTKEQNTFLVCGEGSGNNYIFAMKISDPANPEPLWEATSSNMGYSFRISIGYFQKDADYCSNHPTDQDCITENSCTDPLNKNCVQAAAFVSTNYHTGTGLQVYAFDLKTGQELWNFHYDYGDTSNEIPDAPVLVDKNRDDVVDSVVIGDMEGRIWEIDAATGESPYGTTSAPTPVYEVDINGSGKGYPIAASPAVYVTDSGRVLVFFGTGGADFTPDGNKGQIYAIDITNGVVTPGGPFELFHFQLDPGEKLYASPVVTRTAAYFPTAFGDRENTDPNDDTANGQSGNLHIVTPNSGTWGCGSGGGSQPPSGNSNYPDEIKTDVGKTTGAYTEGNQIVVSTMDGKVTRFGQSQADGNTPAPIERIRIDFWRDF